MKKKILLIVLFLTFILGISLCYSHVVGADSGWDSDYDSGGSWDSGDSWGSDFSWDSGSSSDGDIDFEFFIVIIIIIIVVVSVSRKNNSGNNYVTSVGYEEVSDDILNKYGINREEFKNIVYDKYVIIQKSWMNFDYDELKKLLTDELYNTYVSQLDVLKIKGQKNIMDSFKLIDTKIINVSEENGLLKVDSYLRVEMHDYVVDKDNKVIRGNKKDIIDIEYMISYVRSVSSVNGDTICPNCGAKIDAVARGKCEYCGTIVNVMAKDYVMSRKTNIEQRRK